MCVFFGVNFVGIVCVCLHCVCFVFCKGIVTFLTMSYIVLVNPKVLSVSGIPQGYAASSTCLSASIATYFAAIFGNLPIGCAPGVGLSAYFSYGMMASFANETNYNLGDPELYQFGLLVVFLSGAFVFIMTICKIIPFVVDHIPEFIKVATVVGILYTHIHT